MNVSLTPALEKFVTTKVRSGRYTSASEVVREGLRLLEEHDACRAAQMTAFNKELNLRIASLDRDERVDPAAARSRIQAKSQALKEASRVMPYILGAAAELDLNQIWDYIAEDSIDAADGWIASSSLRSNRWHRRRVQAIHAKT